MIREELQHLAIDLDQLHPHPRNVRQGDVGAICESLKAHGQYRAIVYQQSTKRILAGNHTWQAAKALGWKQIAATPVVCDDEQALRILLIDNRLNDLADYDTAELASILQELEATSAKLDGTGFDGDSLDELLADVASDKALQDQVDAYTQLIKVPQYQIVGEEPEVTELYDASKCEKMFRKIEKANLPDPIKEFLRLAATRHIVFSYSKIAEFYPHQTKEVQQLMEESALVIIDADDAIANGYAVFARTMTDLLHQDSEE